MVSMSEMSCDSMGVGRSRVAEPDVILLELWVCRSAQEFMESKAYGESGERKSLLPFCPPSGCNVLSMDAPGWNWGTEADHRSGTNCREYPAHPGSWRRGFFFLFLFLLLKGFK